MRGFVVSIPLEGVGARRSLGPPGPNICAMPISYPPPRGGREGLNLMRRLARQKNNVQAINKEIISCMLA